MTAVHHRLSLSPLVSAALPPATRAGQSGKALRVAAHSPCPACVTAVPTSPPPTEARFCRPRSLKFRGVTPPRLQTTGRPQGSWCSLRSGKSVCGMVLGGPHSPTSASVPTLPNLGKVKVRLGRRSKAAQENLVCPRPPAEAGFARWAEVGIGCFSFL